MKSGSALGALVITGAAQALLSVAASRSRQRHRLQAQKGFSRVSRSRRARQLRADGAWMSASRSQSIPREGLSLQLRLLLDLLRLLELLLVLLKLLLLLLLLQLLDLLLLMK